MVGSANGERARISHKIQSKGKISMKNGRGGYFDCGLKISERGKLDGRGVNLLVDNGSRML